MASIVGILVYFQTTIAVCEGDFECGFWDAIYVLASTPAFFTSVVLLIVVSLLTQRRDPARPITDVDGNPMPFKNRLGWLRPKNVWRFGSDKDAES